MKRFLVLILFIILCTPVYAGRIDGTAYLQKGRTELEKKQFEGAISSLFRAEKEFPLLGDYALLWISEAYHETGNHRESLEVIRSLLKKYPVSPLIKRARIREIKEAEEVSEDSIELLYRSYMKTFPGDAEIRFLYGRWLKRNGKEDRAKSVFKDIYVEAGPFSVMACSELSPSDMTTEDLIRRASNLIKAMDYKGAESVLKSAMGKDDGSLKNEILSNLGLSLFKQKRYTEAVEVYKEAGDRYWEIRSLYRAGEKEMVNSAVDELFSGGDKRFGSILIAIASDRRRDGNVEEALEMYQKVLDRYPSEKEDALWGIGWTYFRCGEYKKASDIFSRLYSTYGDPKYLYWKARSLREDGDDASKLYQTIQGKEREFYSIMSHTLDKQSGGEAGKLIKGLTPAKGTPPASKKMDRIEALIELRLSNEALSELIQISKNTGSAEEISYICSKFQELGGYKYSVRLAIKAPYREDLHSYLYPRAHWDVVESLSAKYDVDPLLVLSVIREESRFDPDARSVAGALGLMQIMPKTAHRFDTKAKLSVKNSHDMIEVENNIHIGVCYLSHLIKKFGSYTYAVAAYNAGEEIVGKWLQKGKYKSADQFIEDIPYDETRNYVKKVLTSFFEYKRLTATGDSTIEISIEKL